jgi:uncharacterized protein
MRVLCLASAVIAGAFGSFVDLPLAWVLGPMLATAAFSIAGTIPFAPAAGRRFGQILIGSGIGLNLTPNVLSSMLGWIPAMIVTTVLSMLIGVCFSRALCRFGRIDSTTAYYAMLPGGLSEMANIGSQQGARTEAIAMVHALRVALVVLVLPAFIVSLGIDGHFAGLEKAPYLDAITVIKLLSTGFIGVLVVRTLRVNNPWMIGAIVGVGMATAIGWFDGRLPAPLFYLGQFLIGIAVGARFQRSAIIEMMRLAWVASLCVLGISVIMFLYAVLLHWLSDIDVASAALCSSPGGFAEMAATGQILHLNVALIAGFHIVRVMIVNSFATHFLGVCRYIGLVPGKE